MVELLAYEWVVKLGVPWVGLMVVAKVVGLVADLVERMVGMKVVMWVAWLVV